MSNTKERPIIFSGEMVRAILAGKKTQTRRVMKEANEDIDISHISTDFHTMREFPDGSYRAIFDFDGCVNAYSIKCPYGQPGDRLWVRETWNIDYGAITEDQENDWHIVYRADMQSAEVPAYVSDDKCTLLYDSYRGDWRPSIHMPRWASRITLEVVSVRVERVQDISEEDAVAEGIDMPIPDMPHRPGMGATHPSAVFSELWDSINASRGYGWGKNPWVWVVEFKQI